MRVGKIFIGVIVLLHLLTLSISPLPWFDEVFFASLSQQFWTHGTFHVPATVITYEVKAYGFVYFLLTGISQQLGGGSIFSFRVVNFLAGMGVAGLFYRFLRDKRLLWVFLLDPFFFLCLHEGRMDLLATLFILLSFRFLQKKHLKEQVLAGIFALLALLTTPRVAFMGVGMAVYWLVAVWRERKLAYMGAPAVILAGYSAWIAYGFGSLGAFLGYYRQATSAHYQLSAWGWYVGGTGYIPKQQYTLLFLLLVAILGCLGSHFWAKNALGIGEKSDKKDKNLPETPQNTGKIPEKTPVGYYWAFVGAFHVLVHDLGQYSIFLLPVYYLLFEHYLRAWGRQGVYLIVLLGAFNGAYFGAKMLQIGLTYEQRQASKAEAFVKAHIPPRSKVVGEAMYYYAARKNQCAYQLFEVYEDLPTRARLQKEQFGYQYLIITAHSRWRHPEVVAHYLRQHPKLRKIGELNLPPPPFARFARFLPLSQTERAGYSAEIYAVK